MQIVFLNHNVAWKGGFFRAYHWGRHLVRRGHDVTLVTISESRRWGAEVRQKDGIRIVKTPDLLSGRLRSGWDMWDTMHRIWHISRRHFDLVHSVDSRPACILPALAVKGLKGMKVVLDWGDWWGRGGTISERSNSLLERAFAPVETLFEEHFRNHVDANVVLTSALRARALKLGVNPERLVQIPHGADIENIQPEDKLSARSKLAFRASDRFVGYVGAILLKDRALLADSFQRMCTRDRRIRLLVIGNTNIREEDFAPAIRSRVLLTGSVSYEHLQHLIAACDAMLLPLSDTIANRGRWPSKIGDYLAAGRPVVACAVGDVASLFAGLPIGALSKDDPEDFAQVTMDLLENGDLCSLGRNARTTAERQLAWHLLTERLETLYTRVLAH